MPMHPTHPRRRSRSSLLLLGLVALLLTLAAVVVIAPPAGAHSLGGIEPSNYRTRVPAVTTTSATVLPWPGRRPSTTVDPDLPGGA
jgi:hypothetical protein